MSSNRKAPNVKPLNQAIIHNESNKANILTHPTNKLNQQTKETQPTITSTPTVNLNLYQQANLRLFNVKQHQQTAKPIKKITKPFIVKYKQLNSQTATQIKTTLKQPKHQVKNSTPSTRKAIHQNTKKQTAY